MAFKFPRVLSKDAMHFVAGATAGFLTNHLLRYLPTEYNPTVIFTDKQNRYIWSFAVNNAITLGAGAALYIAGKKGRTSKSAMFKRMGEGWLGYFFFEKFLVEPMQYMYIVYPPPPLKITYVPLGTRARAINNSQIPTMLGQNSIPQGQSKYRITG